MQDSGEMRRENVEVRLAVSLRANGSAPTGRADARPMTGSAKQSRAACDLLDCARAVNDILICAPAVNQG